MARYCFYCGRALSPGEKCQCREKGNEPVAQKNSGEKARTKDKSDSFSAGRSPKSKKASDSFFKFKNKQTRGRKEKKRFNTASSFQMPDRIAIMTGLRQFAGFFTRPAETIRQSAQYANRRKAVLLLSLNCVFGGFMLLAMSRHEQLGKIMQLTIVQTQLSSGFFNSFFMFIQGVGFTLSLYGLLLVLVYIVLRWIVRQPVDLIRLISALAPINFYSTLFILLAIMSLSGSLIHSVLLLACALSITTLTLFISLRQLSHLDENRIFSLIILILIVYSALVSLLFSLILPLLATLFDKSIVI
jgi:hypothetical protein